MTDRTAAEVMCCPGGCEFRDCSAGVFGSIVARIHAAGFMIVPRRPTVAMIQDGYDAGRAARSSGIGGQTIEASARTVGYRELAIYAAMTAEGELK